MRRLIQDFPEARHVSPETLAALRAIDPTTDVLYLGPSPKGGRWLVGTVVPDARLRRMAEQTLASLHRIPREKRGVAWARRHWMAHAQRQGFRSVQLYECVEPGGQIVFDLQRADWLHRHRSENEFWQEIDDAQSADAERTRAELTDKHRADDAWQYAFTRSHSLAVTSTPKDRVRSGFTRHTPTAA